MDELEAALPRPRDDEPPDLRSRIVKELRDHLECAYNRELVLTGDAALSARRVREKFGDPAKLARKLWFDAMREKIMSQRLLVGMCAVMTAACLGLGLFTWKVAAEATGAVRDLVREHHDSNQQLLEQNRAALEGSRATNEELLRAVQAVRSTQETQLETGELQIEVREYPSGAPAAGVQVYVSRGKLPEDGGEPLCVEVSGADGKINCGRLKSGSYSLSLGFDNPWGIRARRPVFLRASQTLQSFPLDVPSSPEPKVDVTFYVDWPEDLRADFIQNKFGVVCQFSHPLPQFTFQDWTRTGWASSGRMSGVFLIRTDGEIRHIEGVDLRTTGEGEWHSDAATDGRLISGLVRKFAEDRIPRIGAGPVVWAGSEHRMHVLGLGMLEDPPRDAYRAAGPAMAEFRLFRASRREWEQAVETGIPLQLRPGEPQRISIPLPDELLQVLRMSFDEAKKPREAESKE